MNFRRTIAKTMIFAMALGMFSFTSPNSAKAAAPNVTFDGEAETVTPDTAKFWGVAKVVKDEKKANLTISGTHLQVGTIEPVVGDKIDLSGLSKNKDLHLVFGTTDSLADPGEWAYKMIPAQSKGLTAFYITDSTDSEANKIGTADGGFLVLKKDKVSVTLPGTAKTYMAKIGNSSWTAFETLIGNANDAVGTKLASLAQLGANLSFRIAGTDAAWASKEAKVKLSARSKAPSVKIDPVKGTVSVKKGMEFVVPADGTSNPGAAAWTKVTEAKNTLTNVGLNSLSANRHLLVRTAATKKKLASKVQDITVKFQAAPTEGKADATAEGGTILTDVKVNTKVPYDISKGATITNNTDKEYEFYISPKGTAIDNPKWTKLKAKTTKKGQPVPTVVALKYSKDAKDYTYGPTNENTKLFIRLAGKKQVDNEVTLPSAPAEIALKLAKAAQTVTVSENGVSGDYPNSSATIATAKPGTTYKFNVKVVKMYSKKAPSLKTKVTKKANGVSVKGGKLVLASGDQSGTASLEFKLSKDIFKKDASAVTEVEYSVEGVKGKLTVTFNK